MTTPYQEIAAAAEEFENRNNSARQFIERFLYQFVAYCQIPPEKVRLMKFDKNRHLFTITGNEIFSIHEAIRYDDETDEWSVGVKLIISPSGDIAFGLAVTIRDYKYFVRAGGLDEPQKLVDLNRQESADAYFASVVAMIKRSFLQPLKTTPTKRLGFRVGTDSDISI